MQIDDIAMAKTQKDFETEDEQEQDLEQSPKPEEPATPATNPPSEVTGLSLVKKHFTPKTKSPKVKTSSTSKKARVIQFLLSRFYIDLCLLQFF